MTRIKYNGPENVKRVLGNLVWDNDNNHTVEVADQKMVKTLLDQPNGEFTLAAEDAASESKPKRKEK